MKEPVELIRLINNELPFQLSEKISLAEVKEKLAVHINYLINHDFEKLVYYLYRIDVNESKMKHLLDKNGGENAAGLITDLIIKRQSEKIKSRKENKNDTIIPEDDKW